MLCKIENSPTVSAINGMVFVTLPVIDAPDDTGSLRIQLSPGRAAELKAALESAIITANVQRRRLTETSHRSEFYYPIVSR